MAARASDDRAGVPVKEPGRELDGFGPRDETQYPVKLTKGFEMQATEVTRLQYFLVTGENPISYGKTKKTKEDCDGGFYKVLSGVGLCINHAVETVSWNDAQAFIKELNKIQNKYTYRLPTEAEWEYAARAGKPSSFPYSFGLNDTNQLGNYAWYSGNSKGIPHAVATKKSNPFGLYDMHGNVWEWTQDFYGDYPTTATTDPTGPATGSRRVFRGGSWFDGSGNLRSARRDRGDPDRRNFEVGFRLARSPR